MANVYSKNAKIYGFTTPVHPGYIKIGYTEKDVADRVREICHTSATPYEIVFTDVARYFSNGRRFSDHDFHAYLKTLGVKRLAKDNEFFEIDVNTLKRYFNDFRSGVSITDSEEIYEDGVKEFNITLRPEQMEAKDKMAKVYREGKYNKFLLNAKPRFGKTLTVLEFIKECGFEHVLIATHRPSIGNSWYEDFLKVFGSASDYDFVVKKKYNLKNSINGKQYWIDADKYDKNSNNSTLFNRNVIRFVSLSDLKGSKKFDKNGKVFDTEWDIVVIDESHEAYDTEKGISTFNNINTKFTLNLSGTPYKALVKNTFAEDNMYSWTYEDEQDKKNSWNDEDGINPYSELPTLNLMAYRMSDEIKNRISEVNDQTGMKQCFDMGILFSLDVNKEKFVYEDCVRDFVRNLHTNANYPFSDKDKRKEFAHTVWRVNGVREAEILADILREDEVFKEYSIVKAVADSWKDDAVEANDDDINSAFDLVKSAIKNSNRTITLTCGQLMTGITVPEWTAILMLCNLNSKENYVQSIFRVQNPYYNKVTESIKTNAYVFDFDFTRVLTTHSDIATAEKPNATSTERKERVKVLLNWFPVVGEDVNGELRAFDANDVITQPITEIAGDVVAAGFRHNALFNISIFQTKNEKLIEIAKKIKAKDTTTTDTKKDKNTTEREKEKDKSAEEILGEAYYADLEDVLEKLSVEVADYEKEIKAMWDESDLGKVGINKFNKEMEKKIEAGEINTIEDLHKAEEDARQKAIETQLAKDIKKDNQEEVIRDALKKFMDAFALFVNMFDGGITLSNIVDKFYEKFAGLSDDYWVKITNISLEDFEYLRSGCNAFNSEVFDESLRIFYVNRAKDRIRDRENICMSIG